MKILVTGSEGFIGKALANRLKKDGHEVFGFDILKGQDMLNYDQVQKAVCGIDAVMHLAAAADLNWVRHHPHEGYELNVTGAKNMAFACAESGATLYYASTCCAYGNQKVHPATEETLPNPSDFYAATKLAGENVIVAYAKQFGLKYNVMRFATIYGPGMRNALAPHIFFRRAFANKPILLHGTGEQTRTLTFIDDLTDGMSRLIKAPILGEIINLTTEEEVSAKEMAEHIKKLTNSSSDVLCVADRPGQTHREAVSAAKAKLLCGWQAEHTFFDGLKKTYQWFLDNPEELEKHYQYEPNHLKEV